MTKREMTRLKVAERLVEGEMTVRGAAEVLGLSTRQILRIKKKVRLNGPGALIHGNRARNPVNAVEDKIKDLVVELKRARYPSTNFSHLRELLEEREDINLSRPTVHRILRAAGIASPKRKKKVRFHYYRKRKACPGMMVQLDASPYQWLGGSRLSMHGAIDDATGKVLGLYMCAEETLEGYFEVARQMIKTFGIPVSIYSDRHTIFFNPRGKLSIEDELEGKSQACTQFSRATGELGMRMIPAGSPQAKGRIERLWGTLQDRLTQEFNINRIKDRESANKFLRGYIAKFNRRFSVRARGESVFRKLKEDASLDYILCTKVRRRLDSGSAFSYHRSYYQLVSHGKVARTIPRSGVTVLTGGRIGIKAEYSGKVYSVKRLEAPKIDMKTRVRKKRVYRRVPASHPWKSGYAALGGYDKADSKTLKGLLNSTLAWNPDNQ